MTDLKKKLREIAKLQKEVIALEKEINDEGMRLFKEKMDMVIAKKTVIDGMTEDVMKKELGITGERVNIMEAMLLLEEKANPKKDLIL